MKQPCEEPNNPTNRTRQAEGPKDSQNYHQFDYPKTTNLEDTPEEDSLEDSPEAEDFQEGDTDVPEEEGILEEAEDHQEDRQAEDGDHPHSPHRKQIMGNW